MLNLTIALGAINALIAVAAGAFAAHGLRNTLSPEHLDTFKTAADYQMIHGIGLMLIGHADKIRMQVRSIGDDGKIWINSDSFLPSTLIGHEVQLFSRDPRKPGQFRIIEGGTIEALGAIHFAPPEMRTGAKGIDKKMLYLELQMYGDDPPSHAEVQRSFRLTAPKFPDPYPSQGIASD